MIDIVWLEPTRSGHSFATSYGGGSTDMQLGPDQVIPMIGTLGALASLALLCWDRVGTRLRLAREASRDRA